MSIGSDINRIVAWTQRCSFAYHADEAAEVDALNDISCAIPQGEIAILCGQSGCGKTTYTRLLNGLIPGFYSGDLQGIHMTCGNPRRIGSCGKLCGTGGQRIPESEDAVFQC